jgi:Ni/Fe-hydrogenase subunit HybB-like protein
MSERIYKGLVAVAILGLIVGTWGLVDRVLYGHLTSAYGSYVPWGLWVVFYLFYVGLTAGAFLITILTYVFQVKRFEKIGPLAAFTVLVALLCELTFIWFDLGHMFRVYRFLVTPSFTSLLTWFFLFTNLMLVIYLLESFFLLRGDLVRWSQDKTRRGRAIYRLLALGRTSYSAEDQRQDQKRVRVLSIISLPIGLLFYGTNGAFFAILLNRPIWNSAMTPLLFILAALLSGGALITFLIRVFQRDDDLVQYLGRVILYLLVVFIFLEALQFFVGYQTGTVAILTSLHLIAFGPYWWTFWIVHLLLGSLLPLILLLSRPNNATAVAWACFLIVITFVSVRFNFIIPDLAVYKLDGLEQTFFHPRLRTLYVPSLGEWLLSIWVISLGLLTFLAGTRWLPVLSSNKREVEHA